MCQKGTLAVLAYTYGSQWECPPPADCPHGGDEASRDALCHTLSISSVLGRKTHFFISSPVAAAEELTRTQWSIFYSCSNSRDEISSAFWWMRNKTLYKQYIWCKISNICQFYEDFLDMKSNFATLKSIKFSDNLHSKQNSSFIVSSIIIHQVKILFQWASNQRDDHLKADSGLLWNLYTTNEYPESGFSCSLWLCDIQSNNLPEKFTTR